MKILPITIQYNSMKNKTNNTVRSNQSTVNNMSVHNNSIYPAIVYNRAVSFNGTNKSNGANFEHDCSEMFGDKEHISYNKRDGSFIHQVFRRDGSLKIQEEFHPWDNSEIITKIDETGEKSICKKTPNKVTTEKFNKEGQRILYREIGTDGKECKVVTEYDRGRVVIFTKTDGMSSTKVIDLKTQQYVSTGNLVIDRRYDKNSSIYYTENIVTGKVLKKEKYTPKNELEFLIEYSPDTGCVIREVYLVKTTGGYREYNYDKFGVKQSLIKTSKNGRNKHVYNYARDGKTIVLDMEYTYRKDKSPESEITYHPGTDIIDQKKVYQDNNSFTIFYYKKSPNVLKYAEYFENDLLKEQISYFKDGKRIAFLRQYNDDDSYKETKFSPNGNLKNEKFYSAAGVLYKMFDYNTRTGILTKVTEIDIITKDTKETYYDEYTEEKIKTIISDVNGIIKEATEYYSDGQTPKRKISFNPDRSYSETIYDSDGHIKNINYYNADGTRRVFSGQSYSSPFENRGFSKEYENSDEEFLDEINSTLAHSKKNEISVESWKRLASIMGVEDYAKITNMDHKTYRNLAFKFHPDLSRNQGNEEKCTVLLQIINFLYKN